MNRWPWFQWLVLAPILFGLSSYITACGFNGGGPAPGVVVYGDDFVAGGSHLSTDEIEWRGYNNATVTELLQRLPLNTAPSRVYVMAGLVDFIDNGSEVYVVVYEYQKLVDALATPETEVVALSILYAARNVNVIGVDADELNAKIKAFNTQLVNMCAGGGCRYLDVNATLSHDGYLKESYAAPNGLDLSEAGYTTFGELITRDVNGNK